MKISEIENGKAYAIHFNRKRTVHVGTVVGRIAGKDPLFEVEIPRRFGSGTRTEIVPARHIFQTAEDYHAERAAEAERRDSERRAEISEIRDLLGTLDLDALDNCDSWKILHALRRAAKDQGIEVG